MLRYNDNEFILKTEEDVWILVSHVLVRKNEMEEQKPNSPIS